MNWFLTCGMSAVLPSAVLLIWAGGPRDFSARLWASPDPRRLWAWFELSFILSSVVIALTALGGALWTGHNAPLSGLLFAVVPIAELVTYQRAMPYFHGRGEEGGGGGDDGPDPGPSPPDWDAFDRLRHEWAWPARRSPCQPSHR